MGQIAAEPGLVLFTLVNPDIRTRLAAHFAKQQPKS